MPTIRSEDLFQQLTQYVGGAVRSADANQTGVLTRREEANLDPLVLPFVQAHRAARGGRVEVDAFLADFDQYVRSAVDHADRNHNQLLSVREQGRLPQQLRALIGSMPPAGPAPAPSPSEAPPAIAGAGPFGINGVIPAARVALDTILDHSLDTPTGLAFHPQDGSLWVVNRGDDSSVIIDSPGTPGQRAERFVDDSAHFMNNPTAIAFSRTRNEFATVQETENDYNGHHHGNHFMGPTLWTANRGHYEGGTNSHLDMLHHSPNAMGIAAGAAPRGQDQREYWVFNGQSGCIDRYFFNEPHALGADDHSDGLTYRYGNGVLSRVPGVPSHLALDGAGARLYIADTGNSRIVALNTRTSVAGAQAINGWHDETPLYRVAGAQFIAVTGPDAGLDRPSGLIMKGGDLIVGDYGTGHIKVFGTDGTLKGDVDTGLGARALTGLAEGPDGLLYVLDSRGDRLLRLRILAR